MPRTKKSNRKEPSKSTNWTDDDAVRVITLQDDFHWENMIKVEGSPAPNTMVSSPHKHCGKIEWSSLQYMLVTQGLCLPCSNCEEWMD